MSTQTGKDTLYIDVDDEITTIIDKVRGSHERIIALVLPKRATVLQSIVNMKLLKRTADEAKKHLVLITAEAGLLPLAGSVGIYVAKTLQSKPEIPAGLAAAHEAGEDIEESVSMADDLSPTAPVAAHMQHAPTTVAHPDALDEDLPINLDNAPSGPVVGHDAAASAAAKKGKGGKKFKIPDFNKFKNIWIIGGVALVVLIFMWYMGFVALPRATVSIQTDSTALQQVIELGLSTSASSVNTTNNVVPATSQETQKTATQQADATGQKDKGQKASGVITVTNCSPGAATIAGGTGFSANGLTFVSQTTVTVPQSTYDITGSGFKCRNDGKSNITVVAQNSGANYNLAAQAYTIASNPDKVTAQGAAMTGGTSEIVKVISQADVDGAKQKLSSQDTTAIKQELRQGLTSKGLFALDDSFVAGDPQVTASASVGDEATSVTVTQKATYTMLGAKQDDLKKIVAATVEKKIDKNKQQIIDYGLDKATFKIGAVQGGSFPTSMDVTAVAGTDINVDDIKKQVAGKKSGDAKQIISKYPGVTDVQVNYSPFWVSSIPKSTGKITVTVEKPTTVKHAN